MIPSLTGAVLCLGETMGVVAPMAPEPLRLAETFRMDAGGAESNVAMGLARLGHRVVWRSRLGNDPLGQRVLDRLVAAGVEPWAEIDPDRPTGLYLKDPGAGVHYYRAGSAAASSSPALLDAVRWNDVSIVHVSGILPALSAGCADLVDAVLDRAAAASVTVSFDVNFRPALWSSQRASMFLRELARQADIVFVGLDEAQALWGSADAEDVRRLLPDPDLLVVKDAAVGATAFHGAAVVFEPALVVDVLEQVGAGDAFAAGFLAATLEKRSLGDRLRLAHTCAARVLGTTGDVW
ncbi:sugar kinase [Modestobacter sp. I12A-02628]|uniref:Sugar kinase n=2 Tax=Goekera deserti TaxID=2497753 RepID=A0A7K3WBP3_9ACTN|nr:sugar kinase [Goekera deserti]MPQ98306.1 sugar kinase [Goekera deserti]NDI48133.1 sugar kinase [Goekera deserti]NEL53882.1 sugar kinase [Goekera deserti]